MRKDSPVTEKVRNYSLLFKLFRYLATGSFLFTIDYFVFFILYKHIRFDISLSQGISRSVGACTGFLFHKFFVFKDYRGNIRRVGAQSALYGGLTVWNIFVSAFLIVSRQ